MDETIYVLFKVRFDFGLEVYFSIFDQGFTSQSSTHKNMFVCLIFYVPSTIFQLNRDGSSWAEPVLS